MLLSFFTQQFRYVSTCWIRSKNVAGVHLCSGSAATTNLAVLTNATFALQVTPIPELTSELRCLVFIPDLLQRLILSISQLDMVIEAAGDDVPVFDYAHVFAGDGALAKENVVEPVIKVGHIPFLGDADEEWTIHIDFRFSVILQA